VQVALKITTATLAKTLRTGSWTNVDRLFALPRRLVQNFSISPKMTKSPEQLEAETNSFILKVFCYILAMVSGLFAYSIIFIQQPLFTEAPADKQILAILGVVMTQIFTILSVKLTGKSSVTPPPPPMFNPCQPMMGQQMGFGQQGFGMPYSPQNLDNSTSGFSIDPTRAWTPPPPPTTPPTLEHEDEREVMAQARHEVKHD
jgi:hypothetical protein